MQDDPRGDAIPKVDPTFEVPADPEVEIGDPVTIEELEKRTDYGS